MSNLNDLHKFAIIRSTTAKTPLLFVGHGSPMNAIEENQFVDGFRTIAKSIPNTRTLFAINLHTRTER